MRQMFICKLVKCPCVATGEKQTVSGRLTKLILVGTVTACHRKLQFQNVHCLVCQQSQNKFTKQVSLKRRVSLSWKESLVAMIQACMFLSNLCR